MAPSHLTVDSESAEGMADEEDFSIRDHPAEVTLEDMVNGYDS